MSADAVKLTEEQVEQFRVRIAGDILSAESSFSCGGSEGKLYDEDYAALNALCDAALLGLRQPSAEPVAFVADVYQSRYILEWNGRSYPQGTPLYLAPAAEAMALLRELVLSKDQVVKVYSDLHTEQGVSTETLDALNLRLTNAWQAARNEIARIDALLSAKEKV